LFLEREGFFWAHEFVWLSLLNQAVLHPLAATTLLTLYQASTANAHRAIR
jgi:hypothetical protein